MQLVFKQLYQDDVNKRRYEPGNSAAELPQFLQQQLLADGILMEQKPAGRNITLNVRDVVHNNTRTFI